MRVGARNYCVQPCTWKHITDHCSIIYHVYTRSTPFRTRVLVKQHFVEVKFLNFTLCRLLLLRHYPGFAVLGYLLRYYLLEYRTRASTRTRCNTGAVHSSPSLGKNESEKKITAVQVLTRTGTSMRICCMRVGLFGADLSILLFVLR